MRKPDPDPIETPDATPAAPRVTPAGRGNRTVEVMAAIRGYAADDATVIFGTVYDESLGDALRVTVVATGLNNPQARKANQPEVVWRQATGTHDVIPTMADLNTFAPASASAAFSKVSMDSALSTSAGMALTGSGSAPSH